MSKPFLILHKVRGEPAFDIAGQMVCRICQPSGDDSGPGCDECDGEGFWWIISTSGHRAYPYWDLPLPYTEHSGRFMFAMGQTIYDNIPPMPEGLPDHCTVTTSPHRATGSLIAALGLDQPPPSAPIRRRV